MLCHDINTGGSPPICSPPYQIADKWREQVRGVLDGLCAEGILVPSKSPWSSSIVPVPKKDGSVRVCVDFHKINKVTVLDPYCIPLVTDIVDRVADCQYLSKLDLNQGFHQVPLAEDVQMKTAIITPFGKFQFTTMPFGLVNSTLTFQ